MVRRTKRDTPTDMAFKKDKKTCRRVTSYMECFIEPFELTANCIDL